MKTRTKKFSFASLGLCLPVFTCTFLVGINPYLFGRITRTDTETTAFQSISTIRTLQAQYASKHQGKFAPDFDEMIKSVQLDDKFKGETPIFNGYIYTMKVEPPSGNRPAFYSINADPLEPRNLFADDRHFYYDSTLGTIKITEQDRQANAADPSI